jgi:hypothetical protein
MLNLGIALWSAIGAGIVAGTAAPSFGKKATKTAAKDIVQKEASTKVKTWFESEDGKLTLSNNNETSSMALKKWNQLSPAEIQLINHEFKEAHRKDMEDLSIKSAA